MIISTKKLPESIRAIRKELLMTQGDIAEKAGIDIKTISRIERGEISPTARTLEKILSVLLAERARLGHPINKISIIFQPHEQ